MTSELRNWNPSAREATALFLRDLLAGDKRASAVQSSQVRGITDVLDAVPVVGNWFALDDAYTTLSAGIANRNPSQIANGMALGALAVAPLPLLRKASRGRIADAVRGIEPPQVASQHSAVAFPQRGPAQVNERAIQGIEGSSIAHRSWGPFLDPPEMRRRPFEHDYPGYPETVPPHNNRRLLQDIDGRPIQSRWVVGRRMLGGPDKPFPETRLDSLAKALTGQRARNVSASALGEDVYGSFSPYSSNIDLLRDIAGTQHWRNVYRHELGHAIDHTVGPISLKGLDKEPLAIYSGLRNPFRYENGEHFIKVTRTPENFGYTPDEAPPEYIAEAIRAYLSNPNYIKTIAPKTAARIREAWNSNPNLAGVLHFNGAMAPVLAAGLSLSDDDAPGSEEPRGRAPIDPSDPRQSDRLLIEEWMKLRDERNEGEGAGRVRLNLLDLPPTDELPTPEWMNRRRRQVGKPHR